MTYRFGIFEFDDRAAILTRADRPVALEPQPARALARAGATARFIRHLGRLEFCPPGAPAVRIRFEREGAKIVAFTIADPDVVVRAKRVG